MKEKYVPLLMGLVFLTDAHAGGGGPPPRPLLMDRMGNVYRPYYRPLAETDGSFCEACASSDVGFGPGSCDCNDPSTWVGQGPPDCSSFSNAAGGQCKFCSTESDGSTSCSIYVVPPIKTYYVDETSTPTGAPIVLEPGAPIPGEGLAEAIGGGGDGTGGDPRNDPPPPNPCQACRSEQRFCATQAATETNRLKLGLIDNFAQTMCDKGIRLDHATFTPQVECVDADGNICDDHFSKYGDCYIVTDTDYSDCMTQWHRGVNAVAAAKSDSTANATIGSRSYSFGGNGATITFGFGGSTTITNGNQSTTTTSAIQGLDTIADMRGAAKLNQCVETFPCDSVCGGGQ